jgi:hypothetical protein
VKRRLGLWLVRVGSHMVGNPTTSAVTNNLNYKVVIEGHGDVSQHVRKLTIRK